MTVLRGFRRTLNAIDSEIESKSINKYYWQNITRKGLCFTRQEFWRMKIDIKHRNIPHMDLFLSCRASYLRHKRTAIVLSYLKYNEANRL